MRPNETGWLADYLRLRKQIAHGAGSITVKPSHPEQALYRILQPSGLMYGQAFLSMEYPNADTWSGKDQMKILLVESLFGTSQFYYGKKIQSDAEYDEMILKTLDSIGSFYNTIFPELATPSKTLFGKKKTPIELAEKIIDKRIQLVDNVKNNFWVQFFHNSLLFLDIFIFGQWIHTTADRIVSNFFKYEREELRFSVVKVIAAAAHANNTAVFEERKLLDYFLQSANLKAEKKQEAVAIFEKGIEVEEINLPTNNSWILKKYFLEMSILTIWADKRVDSIEQEFLNRLCTHLGFSENDLENSFVAIEGFVLEHWDKLDHLQNRQNYDQVSDQYIKRLSRIVANHKSKLFKDVQSNKELMALLKKAKSRELTDDEKKTVQDLLIVTLTTVPTFVTIALPQRFLTLPILMRILPADFFAEL